MGADLRRHGRILLNAPDERACQGGDEDRSRERRTDRRAEVRRRVLQTADLGAELVGHRGHRDRPELGSQSSDPQTGQQQRQGDDLGGGGGLEGDHQDQDAHQQGHQPQSNDPAR